MLSQASRFWSIKWEVWEKIAVFEPRGIRENPDTIYQTVTNQWGVANGDDRQVYGLWHPNSPIYNPSLPRYTHAYFKSITIIPLLPNWSRQVSVLGGGGGGKTKEISMNIYVKVIEFR